jgi:hypothetical protein
MNITSLIIEDFYSDPYKVREFALMQDYFVKGNYPGARTKSFFTKNIKKRIEQCMPWAGKITTPFDDNSYNGAFQYTTEKDKSWIHSDIYNMWAGVCYLTPDAPHTGGTGLYRYKETGAYQYTTTEYDGADYSKWDLIDTVGNKFNRLVIYNGNLFHASLDYFGKDIYTGRLFQTFFFETENKGSI